jgi:hypothetical protein
MNLAFDLDGVFADFNRAAASLLPKLRLPVNDPSFPPVWDWPQHYGATDEETAGLWKRIDASSHFWVGLQAYPEALTALKRIENLVLAGDRVYYITCRSGRTAKMQTELWLHMHGVSMPTVLIADSHHDKAGLLRGLRVQAYIDDRPETLEHIIDEESGTMMRWDPSRSVALYMIRRPWNGLKALDLHEEGVVLVNSVDEMLDDLGV